MMSLAPYRGLRESYLMSTDGPAPRRRTGIRIRVYEVAPGTQKRRDVCTISAGYDRDAELRTKSPTEWPPCTCPRCGVAK